MRGLTAAERIVERYLEAAVPTYTAIFLDEGSKKRLLMWWRTSVKLPFHPAIYADHVTLRFNPSKAEVERTPLGENALVQVLGFASDEKGQAVLVRPSVPSANHFPHVTMSTAKGVNPVYSNQLLAKGFTRKSGPILRGVIDYR